MRPLCRCRCRCGRQRIQASQIINLNHIRHQSSNYAATSSSFTPTLDPSSRITPNSSSHSPSASSSSSSSSDLASLLARHGLNNSTSSFNASSLQTNATFPIFDPLKLVGDEVSFLRNNVQKLLGSGHPALDTIAKYYFQAEGKHIRPLIVLLISQATNNLAPGFVERMNMELAALRKSSSSSSSSSSLSSSWKSIDDPLEVRSDEVLNDANPHFSDLGKRNANTNTNVNQQSTSNILPSQRRLAEITEMIHVASLLHDDVIDASGTRRSQASAPSAFGNKLSILGGDFLLARASLYLSRLGSNEVVELVASILANLVEGEVMQIKGNAPNESSSSSSSSNGKDKQSQLRLTPEIFEYYMKKTYLKTASLIAKTSRAAVVLGGAGEKQGWVEGEKFKDIAYSYGRNLGIAFQLVDDLLDFTGSDIGLGKPSQGADLKLGLATAPALFAWEEFPEMGEMVMRKFEEEGDVERARYIVTQSSGPAKTAALAESHAQMARAALEGLPESEAREALEGLTRTLLKRTR